ncbi:DUF4240 domain-containing protein [Streptomyces cadmiisoli]|uniref:DUF4240 domain-containing protein n=1 Tax=Streptomyces cadmiisoli TaxID=2184053 RepID=UPI00366959A1
MDTEASWRVVDTTKDSEEPLTVAVADHLSALPAEEVLAFEYCFSRLHDAVYRWERTGGGSASSAVCWGLLHTGHPPGAFTRDLPADFPQ